MLRSTFTKDGTKVLVCNGGTDNVTVFDWETMQPEAIIELRWLSLRYWQLLMNML